MPDIDNDRIEFARGQGEDQSKMFRYMIEAARPELEKVAQMFDVPAVAILPAFLQFIQMAELAAIVDTLQSHTNSKPDDDEPREPWQG